MASAPENGFIVDVSRNGEDSRMQRGHGGTGNPPRNRKSETGNPPPTAGAPEFYPNQFKTGKLGGCDVTMTELWNAALAA